MPAKLPFEVVLASDGVTTLFICFPEVVLSPRTFSKLLPFLTERVYLSGDGSEMISSLSAHF